MVPLRSRGHTSLDHNVARTMTYKYEAKVTQKGHQATKHGSETDKAEEKRWVMADVVIRQSGTPIRGHGAL